MQKIFLSFLIFFFSILHTQAATFKNYNELYDCVETYNTFFGYKKNLKNCFQKKGISIKDDSLKLIKKDSGIIQNIIELDLPKESTIKKPKRKLSDLLNDIFKPDLEKIEEKESIFNKPSALSSEYKEANFSLDNKDFRDLNNYIKANPESIFSLTEDINILTYKNNYLSEFKRQEVLLNIYNSFDVVILASKVPPPAEATAFGGAGGMIAVAAVAAAAGGGGGSSGGGSPPTLSFAVSSTAVGECDSNVTITASLTAAHSSNVTVTWTVGGTATQNTDYTLSSTSQTITAGATSGTITLDPTNDTTVETSETVTLAASVSGVSTTGNTSTTITLHDYVLKCNATAFTVGTTTEQNTIKGRSSWTSVNGQSGTVHPYELVNLHKAHSFKSGSTTLTGNGQTVYVMDDAMHNNHDSFSGKTVTMLDTPAVSNSSVQHGTHVASIISGVVGGSTHGVAPDADIVFSTFNDNGTAQATDIDTARTTHSAIAMNNSWGYSDGWNGSAYTSSVTWAEVLSSANSASQNIRQYLNSSSMHAFGSHTSTWITAMDNFQNSGVVIWASSNYVNDTDVSFLAALPAYFNGTDDSVDLSDAWLSVMYADYVGSSTTISSTSDLDRKGNPCGAAKEWCLVVDDYSIGAAGYIDSGGTSQYSTISGSSMGAPQVSGMIALLGQAFPSHTPAQLTDRLLASANNTWFTSSGNTTFTTHGASVKHGYNDEWGHGVPDMEAALAPITSNSNPFSFGFASPSGGGGSGSSGSGSVPFSQVKKLPVTQTSMKVSSSLGDGILNGLKNKTAYAYDALNGGFKYNVTDFINYDSLNEQKIENSIDQELNYLQNLRLSQNKSTKDVKKYEGEYFNFRDKYDRGLSVTLDQPNLALQNFNLFNNQNYKNPFTSENKGVGFNNKFYFFGNDVLVGYNNSNFNPLTSVNKDLDIPMETLALSLNLDSDKFDLISFTTGLLKEKNTFLLSEGSGAFNLNDKDNLSNFFGLNLSKNLNDFGNIYFSTMLGNSKLDKSDNSFIIDSSDVLSSSFEMNYEFKNPLKNDQFNISFSQPNRVEKGDMTFRFVGLSNKNGVLPYEDHKVSLSPSGRQKDLTVSYYKNHSNNLKTGIKAIITDDLGHVKQDNLDTNLLLSATYSF
jgi:subtilisin family serine protease